MASEHPHVANQHVGPVFQVRSLPSRYLKLGARYYNPTTGRFTQPDPSGQEPNTYTYAGDNPTNNTDPTGLYNIRDWAETVGIFAGAGTGIGATVGCVGTAVVGCVEGAAPGGAIGLVGGTVFGAGYGLGEWISSW